MTAVDVSDPSQFLDCFILLEEEEGPSHHALVAVSGLLDTNKRCQISGKNVFPTPSLFHFPPTKITFPRITSLFPHLSKNCSDKNPNLS